MSRLIAGPFNRVEGDLEVQLEIEAGRVREARVVAPLFRGFERMLLDKAPLDALVYVPRICGICSVSQSMAAAAALADAAGISMPPNGQRATNLILAAENVADHFTHFYHFFMPDFARPVYAGERWFASAERRFKAVTGSAAAEALEARAGLLQIMGILAGKWPHSLSLQPGGITRAVDAAEQVRLLAIVHRFRRFLERTVFSDGLENLLSLRSAVELDAWAEKREGDFAHFLRLAEALEFEKLGRAGDVFMSYGAYPQDAGHLFSAGVWDGERRSLDTDEIREDSSHGWMKPLPPSHPRDGRTEPDAEAVAGYTWCKAPRLSGRPVEVGAIARQLLDEQPVVRDLVKRAGGNVRSRVVARLLETARVVVAMEDWIRALEPAEPYYLPCPLPDDAEGQGLVEAARGSLGHWLRVDKGRIAQYQIIAPTTWNFSPRDAAGQPGPLEQALLNAPVRDGETDPVSVQHIVRSFDPCMVCTVH